MEVAAGQLIFNTSNMLGNLIGYRMVVACLSCVLIRDT
jgi:hypothetical protein